jgi:hypothetical protein
MEGTTRSDKRAGPVQIGIGDGKEGRLLVAEAERAELIEPPPTNAVVLGLELLVDRIPLGKGCHRQPFVRETLPYLLKRQPRLVVVASA